MKSQFLLSLLILLPCFCRPGSAQENALGKESAQIMSRAVDKHQLRYLLQEPAGPKPVNGWPLLLFLHGYGECGNNLNQVKKHGPPKLIDKFPELSSCILISPQCPRDSWWRIQALKALVDDVVKQRKDVDKKRLYITGLSMGGYGIWSFLSRYPHYFTAAIPICGGGNPFNLPSNRPGQKKGITNEFQIEGLKKASQTPIWTFHGKRDRSVPIKETQNLVKTLKAAGSKTIQFTVYPNAGHVDAWQNAYNDRRTWQWLFAQ
ncbi:MAG: prolyl oligopeptidase family serine peptidase [Planctomycetota bacterium]|nr:prolyl oligopeptidase family serine peptidase [Planctomycetota bacterium]